MVTLLYQRYKPQTFFVRRDFNAQSRIGGMACHRLGNRGMRGFLALVALHGAGRHTRLHQQVIEQHTGARALGAVDVTQAGAAQVGQARDAQRVVPGDDQTLRAVRKTNQFVLARFEQAAIALRRP